MTRKSRVAARKAALVEAGGRPEVCDDAAPRTDPRVMRERDAARLDSVRDQFEQALAEDEPLARPELASVLDPVLAEADAVVSRWSAMEGGTPDLVIESLGRLATATQTLLSDQLDRASDGSRALLYAVLTVRRVAQWPLGPDLQRGLSEVRSEFAQELYGSFRDEWKRTDPAACWFVEGAVADPDASIVIDLHRVEEVRYSRCLLEHEGVLVPRSRFAQWIHDGANESEFDPKWLPDGPESAEIARLQLELTERTTEVQQVAQAMEGAEREKLKRSLDRLDANLEEQESDSGALARARKIEINIRIEEKESRRRVEGILAALAKDWQPQVASARKLADKVRGLGFFEVELPMIFFFIAFVASLGLVTTGLGGYAVLIGVVVGIVLGYLVGSRVRRWCSQRPDRVEAEFRQALAAARKEGGTRLDELRAELASEPERLRESHAAERAKIEAESEDVIRKLQQDSRVEVERLEQSTSEQIAAIEVASRDTSRARPFVDAEQFPVVQQGLTTGFQRGRAPSTNVMKVMHDRKFGPYLNSLTPAARNALMMERRRLPRAEFDELMERIIK